MVQEHVADNFNNRIREACSSGFYISASTRIGPDLGATLQWCEKINLV